MSAPGTHHFEGYDIPIELILKTGGGPANFDLISSGHIHNVTRFAGLEPSFSVLEMGCGIGRDAIPLTKILSAQAGGRYIGVDIIQPSIEWCARNISPLHPNFTFHHADIDDKLHNPAGMLRALDDRLPAEDGSIDRIIAQSVFTHILRPELDHYFREFRRILRPGGRVYCTVFLYDDAILRRARETNLTQYDLRFEHPYAPGVLVNSLEYLTGAVAYTRPTIDEAVAGAGLRHAREPLKGAWSGFYEAPDDGQDVLILARAGEIIGAGVSPP